MPADRPDPARRPAIATAVGAAIGWWLGEIEAAATALVPKAPRVGLATDQEMADRPPPAVRTLVRLVPRPADILTVPVDLPAVSVLRLEAVLALRVAAEWPLPGDPPVWRAELALAPRLRLVGRLAMMRADRWAEGVARARADRLSVLGLALPPDSGARAEILRERTASPKAGAPFRLLAAALALALGLAGWSHLDRLEMLRADAARELEALRAAARPTVALEARHRSMHDLLASLSDEAQGGWRGIDIAEALAGSLPDGAWLESLAIDGERVRLRGRAADPATALRAVEEGGGFAGARFAAPVVAEDGGALSRFELLLDRPATGAQGGAR